MTKSRNKRRFIKRSFELIILIIGIILTIIAFKEKSVVGLLIPVFSFYLIVEIEDISEEDKDRKILNQNAMILNRDILIKNFEETLKILTEENKKGNETMEILEEIRKLISSNKNNNEKLILRKIKELVENNKQN